VADQALQEIAGQVFSKGPNGETASPPGSADLTDEEVAQIKALGLKAAIVMHTGGDDWSQTQINGLHSEGAGVAAKPVPLGLHHSVHRIGCGIIGASGELHDGADGAAGDIGHVRVPG
jgi:hypothetical protein